MRRFRVALVGSVLLAVGVSSVALVVGCSSGSDESAIPSAETKAITKQKMEEMQKGYARSVQDDEEVSARPSWAYQLSFVGYLGTGSPSRSL